MTLSLSSGAGSLQGTANLDIGLNAGNGVVTFSGLQINSAGNQQLTASASGLTSAVSASFNVAQATLTVTATSITNQYGSPANPVLSDRFAVIASGAKGWPAGTREEDGSLGTTKDKQLATLSKRTVVALYPAGRPGLPPQHAGVRLPIGSPSRLSTLAGQPGIEGTNDGTGPNAHFWGPSGVAVDNSTSVYVADVSTIRKGAPVGTNWVVTTLAGQPGIQGDADGTGRTVLLFDATGVAVDTKGNLYVADTFNNTIRKGVFQAFTPTRPVLPVFRADLFSRPTYWPNAT